MSDLKERVGYMTGGNANLIPFKGALVVGDGSQTVYLMPETDGLVLTLDSTTPEGMAWAPGGGGGADVKVKVSTTDTTTDFLDNKVTVTSGELVKSITSPGGNEKENFGLADTDVEAGSYVDATITVDAKGRITAASSGAARQISMSATFLDHEEAQQGSNGGPATAFVASTGRNFAIFEAGSTVQVHMDFSAFNESGSGITVQATVKLFVNCANPTSQSGGTQVLSVDIPDLTPTTYSAVGTFVAPAGAGFVSIGLGRGTDGGGSFGLAARSIGVTFTGNGA